MDDYSLASVRRSLDFANFWMLASTVAVTFGVVVEFAELLLFNSDMQPLQRRILFVGAFLVIVGCAGEFCFEKQAGDAEAQLQRASEEKVAALTRAEAADNRIATQAAAKAASLGVTVGTLGQTVKSETARANILANEAAKEQSETSDTIAELNRGRADLDKARADAQGAAKRAEAELSGLETRVKTREPRILTEDQRKQLITWLSPANIPKPKLLINWLISEPEALALAQQFEAALKAAGYSVSEADFGRRAFGSDRTGIVIEVKDLNNQPKGAATILKAMDLLGFAVTGAQENSLPDNDTVEVFFSAHP